MAWEMEATDEFAEWFRHLPEALQDAITAKVEMLGGSGQARRLAGRMQIRWRASPGTRT